MVLERDYEFTNLSTNQADTIAIISGADLVMFGFLNDFSTTRSGTLSTTTKHTRPVLIKVYDRKKNALVLYERLTLEANWGLLNNRLTLNQIGTKIAQLLKNQGY
jgi:ATP-dependent protease Clp ATPase subunit